MIRYGSVCSGVEAASLAWEPLGWTPAWFSEIDPTASGVLAYHWPDVPNLGDMLADDFVSRAKTHGHIDVLVGGTPCQSWSVAGKREGANDPRGKLTYRFLTIAKELNPEWIVWENVPGILSVDNGKPFEQFLDYLLALGYLIHCDILNAEFFGVPQRRRRVFVVCHRANALMKSKTPTSVTMLIETLGRISLNILGAHLVASGRELKLSESSCDHAEDGLRRTMRPFLAAGDNALETWLENSAAVLQNVHAEPECLVLKIGHGTKMAIRASQIATATKSLDSKECRDANIPTPFWSTEWSPKKCWAEVFSLAKLCTTSTTTSRTTEETIWWLLQVLARTGKSMALLGELSPCYSSAALSISTAIKEFTNYVRSTDEPLFVESGIRNLRADILREAEHTCKVVASAREGFDPREVLFEPKGVRGDIETSGEARKETPGDVVPSLVASGRGVERAGDPRGQDPVIPVLEAGARTGKSTTDKRAGIGIGKAGDPMYTLQTGKQHAVAVAMRGRDGGATCEMGGDVANALRSADGGGSKPFVLAETCPTLCASGKAAGSATQQDAESGALIPTVASTIRAADGHHGHSSPCGDGCDNLICTAQNTGQGYWKESSVGATLRCCGKGGESRNANLAVIAFSSKDNGGDATQDISPTLRAAGHDKSHANAGAPPAVCINARQDPITTREITGPLDVFGNSHGVTTGFRVRRLLPVECELLQGMPPGHTARTPDKELADGPRYKLIGNSMAVPVMRWIGRRIQAAEKNSK